MHTNELICGIDQTCLIPLSVQIQITYNTSFDMQNVMYDEGYFLRSGNYVRCRVLLTPSYVQPTKGLCLHY